MAGLSELNNVWNTIKEVDLRPIRQQAEREVRLAVLAEKKESAYLLIEQMRSDPNRAQARTQTPVLILPGDTHTPPDGLDLLILLLDIEALKAANRDLIYRWSMQGVKLLVMINTDSPEMPVDAHTMLSGVPYDMLGAAGDGKFLNESFVPAVMRVMPAGHLALARQFPLFRAQVARELINDTCVSNAAYALTTGLAEIVPGLNIPLNVADMVVLTKAQAFLAYRLGLALGLPVEWQSYVAEFGGVLGGGFLWRQLARSLIGLVPVWGIIPKVAVAYSGTYVVGQAIYQWYLTGKHLTRKQIQGMYRQAFQQGKEVARTLRSKLPSRGGQKTRRPILGRRRTGQSCPNCGKTSSVDASFCQYCGRSFGIQLEAGPLDESAEDES